MAKRPPFHKTAHNNLVALLALLSSNKVELNWDEPVPLLAVIYQLDNIDARTETLILYQVREIAGTFIPEEGQEDLVQDIINVASQFEDEDMLSACAEALINLNAKVAVSEYVLNDDEENQNLQHILFLMEEEEPLSDEDAAVKFDDDILQAIKEAKAKR